MFGFWNFHTNNNRKMTPGRVDAGKSTFKGCVAEQEVVELKKEIEETARMIFAIDIKLDDPSKKNDWENSVDLKAERKQLATKLNELLTIFEEKASDSRFNLAMEALDQEERHRRHKRKLKPLKL